VSRHLRMTVPLLLAALFAAACGDATGPDDGSVPFVLHLTTPFPDYGALLVVLYGPLPEAVEVVAGSAELVVHSIRVADTLRIAVFGTIVSGPLGRLDLPAGTVVSQISGRVEDAASRGAVQRDAVSGYTLRLER